MAQHDYVIDNQTSAALRADLNNALAAIVSQNSGSSAPSTTYANQFWYDTTNNLLKQRNETNTVWITLGTLDQTNNKFEPNQTFATQAEAQAGTNNTKPMTPLRTAEAIAALAPRLTYVTSYSLSGTTQADFSGFYGIPSTANTVILTLEGASLASSSQQMFVQLGTSSAYNSTSPSTIMTASGTSVSVQTSTTSQLIWVNTASAVVTGKMVFTKYDPDNNLWVQSSTFHTTSSIQYGSGSVALSGTLAKIRVFAGSGNFDAGRASVSWSA